MKRRWIFRGFFIGLLLLCVGGWIESYRCNWGFRYGGFSIIWETQINWGRIGLVWIDGDKGFWAKHWKWEGSQYYWEPAASESSRACAGFYEYETSHLGFNINLTRGYFHWVFIPFYFPTTISAGLLLLAWRKTRPKPVGRAFPVEVKQSNANEEKTP